MAPIDRNSSRPAPSGAVVPLEAKGLVRTFGGLRAVDEMSISLRRGEMLGVIGPNGAGKTTLFNLLAGSIRPSAGSVYAAGRDLTRPVPKRGLVPVSVGHFRFRDLSHR